MPTFSQIGQALDHLLPPPPAAQPGVAAWALLVLLSLEIALMAFAERRLAAAWLSRVPRLGYLLVGPGTALHESAHLLVAVLVGARIRRFVPFWPHRDPDGSLRLGYVAFDPVGPARTALIAVAPLLLVPVFLLGASFALLGTASPADMAAHLGSAGAIRALAWATLVILGSRGAFPSPGDHVGFAGVASLAALTAFLGAGLWTWGGLAALELVLLGAVAGLAIPALVDALLLAGRKLI